MTVRRLISALSVCLAASTSVAVAQPTQADKKGPIAPAKEPDPVAGGPDAPAAGGEVVQMTEDAPPADLDGKDENPDAPKTFGGETSTSVAKPAVMRSEVYPIAEAARPITLPRNMSEVSIGPHMQVSPYQGADALRARYGITDKIQLGLAYVMGGVFDDPSTPNSDKLGFHPGKAVGLDLTVMLEDWVGVRIGVPVYIDPLAVGITLGAPMRWRFGDGKYALGALDDLLSFRVKRFVPSFFQEALNAAAAVGTDSMMGNNTIQSRGSIRFSGYGIMQHSQKVAFIGRLGVTVDDFSTTRTDGGGGLSTFVRAGVQYTPRRYLDLGISLGFDDMANSGSFGPAGLLAVRI